MKCFLDRAIYALTTLFVLDRLLKFASVVHFFRRTRPTMEAPWPTVSMIQPITRGASGLVTNLRSRAELAYPAPIEHILVCDEQDTQTQIYCRAVLEDFPTLDSRIVLVPGNGPHPASKLTKLNAGLAYATSEVLCFIDDDVALRPDALTVLLPYLYQPKAGAVFGLACYTNWRTLWSSLMSLFVNTQALISYIPLTYLTEPFTITGHCFALQRRTFDAVGGFEYMEERVDDDHELARRVRRAGLRCVQTPLIYDVNNDLASLRAYLVQMKRWFIFPRQAMLPFLTPWEQAVSLIGSIGNLLPSCLLLIGVVTRRRSALHGVRMSLSSAVLVHAACEQRYLRRQTPLKRWPLLPVVFFLTPLQVLWALLSNNEIEWRGQRVRIERGGRMEIVR